MLVKEKTKTEIRTKRGIKKLNIIGIDVDYFEEKGSYYCTPFQGCHLRDVEPDREMVFSSYGDMIDRFCY